MRIASHTSEKMFGSHIVKEGITVSLLEMTFRPITHRTPTSEARVLVYTEALLAGSGTLTKDAFINALALLGSSISVHAHNDALSISVRSRNENLKKTLALLVHMLTEPSFAHQELGRIKTHIDSALKLAKEDARPRAHDAFINSFVSTDDSRYTFPIDALRKKVATVTEKELRSLHAQVLGSFLWYTCGGTYESTILIHTTLEKFHNVHTLTPRPKRELEEIKQAAPFVSCIDIPHKQNIEFSIGSTIPFLITDTDYPAFLFGIFVLGIRGGFSGRLMSTVREKEGLTYMIYANVEEITAEVPGFWRIATFFSPKDSLQGVTSTIREVTKIFQKGITEDELVRFKAIIKTRFSLVDDSLLKKVGEVHSYTTAGMSHGDFKTFQQSFEHMTRSKVNLALRKYLTTKFLCVSGAGPTKHVQKALENIFRKKQ